MIDGTFVRSDRGIAAAVLAGLVGGCLVTAPPAVAEVHLEQYVEVSQCTPATGQECAQAADVEFTVGPNESVQAHFTGASGGCSDVLIRFLSDGYPHSDWIRVGPNQTISSGSFVTGSGTHVLKLTAMGVEGGCNTGVLNAWGGTVRLDSQARRPEPDSTYDDLPPCLPWIIAPQCQLR